MLEWVPLIIVGGAIIPSALPLNEKKRIIHVFENTDFCIKRPPENKKEYPMFIRKTENETAKVYYFQLPLGLDLADHPKLVDRLNHSLNRSIEVKGDSILEVWIYKISIPKFVHYKDIPEPPSKWDIPLGKTHRELLWHNFDTHQHITVAGRTRWGKTKVLKMIMTYLIEHYPDDVEFYILDLKGGLAFHKFRKLEQVKCVASNFNECEKAFREIRKHIERQEHFFKKNDYEDVVDTPIKKRTFIIIDEAGELSADKGMTTDEKKQAHYFTSTISHIARVSAGLGFRMLFATQYPTGDILPRQLKANASARIAFRLETETHSEVAIGEPDAIHLPVKGRMIYKTVDRHIVQATFISNEEMWNRLRRWEVDTTSEEVRETRKDTIDFG